MRTRFFLALVLAAVCGSPAAAHYNMLLPSTASAKKAEVVTFTYQWGHPFEHQLFDAPAPVSVAVLAPDGKKIDLTKTLEKTTVPGAGEKKVVAYQFKFTPDQRGDYLFLLQTPEIWMEEDGTYLEDTVKVVLHVQAQKGWDAKFEEKFELLPLTRPYGLQPSMVFQAQVLLPTFVREKGISNHVEIERYNSASPKELPPDEQITRTVKPDANGVATTTLTEPGWWCLTAGRDGGQVPREGKKVWKTFRTTLWVFVDEKPGSK
jgi:cobalt/nickel transport protein